VTADFEHELGQKIEGLPAFYDGDGTWIVRFSPTTEGVWRGRTQSADESLDGIELGPIDCTGNGAPHVHGRLMVHPEYSHRFMLQDGLPFVPLGFEFDWMFAYHQAKPEACLRTLELLAERGFNYIVTNIYAHTGFSDPASEYVYGPPAMYVFGGTNDQPDHTVLNVEFFRDLDRLVACLHELGIVAHFMIQVQNKHVKWPERRSPEDDQYWRYVVARYQAYGNIVWDVGKESYNLLKETGSHDYTIDRIRLIRQSDAYRHLVTVHDSEGGSACRFSAADGECDFVSDQIHLKDAGAYYREAARRFRIDSRPYMNIEYGYEIGADDIKTYKSWTTAPWQDMVVWAWSIYTGGGYPCYYYNNMAWDLVKPEPEPSGWKPHQWMSAFLDQLDLRPMLPDREYVSRGMCLAEPGRQFLVFLPEGGEVDVDLTSVEGAVRCEMLDVFTGERVTAEVENKGFWSKVENGLADPTHPCAIAIIAEGGET
jgi:hypothetical protein